MKTTKLITIILLSLVIFSVSLHAQALQQGQIALVQHKYDDAQKYLHQAAAEEKNMDDRVQAVSYEGLLYYLIMKDFETGRGELTKALAWSNNHSQVFNALSRLEIAAANYQQAYDYAGLALKHADKKTQESESRKAGAAAVLDCLRSAVFAGKKLSPQQLDLLAEVKPLLMVEIADNPGDQETSINLLDTAILLGDGPLAYQTWLTHFQLLQADPGYGALVEAKKLLADSLPNWNLNNNDPALASRIISGLGESFLLNSATVFASISPEGIKVDPQINKILLTADYARKVRKLCDAYYQTCAVGKEDVPGFYISLLEATVDLVNSRDGAEPFQVDMEKIKSQGKPVIEAYFEELKKILRKDYHLLFTAGSTAGYYDLHMGYIIEEDRRTINQHGKSAEITLVNLDPMVSNGFQSWAWNYYSQHGGWATKEEIIRVAPAYSSSPFRTWKSITDPEYLKDYQDKIDRDSLEDVARAKADPYAYLPGTSAKMYLQTWRGLKKRLEEQGYSGDDLRLKFVSEARDAVLESSIFAHEGRHVIDKQSGITSSPELEFRAKLSEIYFTRLPRRALQGAIFTPNIGDKTGHGQANLRVIKGIVAWMENNKDKIAEFDSSLPAIIQLDKLDDEQLKAAAISMDPLLK